MLRRWLSVASLGLALLAFLLLGSRQLDLPGLHYDEAKEAGLNAMQLLTGQPVTAFRDATVTVGPWRLPLMVQDYIGSLNVLLAVPFLAVGGVNVVALRWLPLLTGAGTLALVWLIARRLHGPVAAAIAAGLLAVSPSFVFWSRQGVFVTNLTALLFMASLWTGLRWWAARPRSPRQQRRWLWLTALLWGLGLYAKLLFLWAIGALVIVGLALLAAERLALRRHPERRPHAARPQSKDAWLTWAGAAICFLIPLTPLIIFNIRTGGTLTSIFGNLGRSYYGVDNSAYLPNLAARLGQAATLLRGDQFWYLGEVQANAWAVWLAAGALAAAAVAWAAGLTARAPRALPTFLLPLALLLLAVAQSAFTVSDLFVTHFALLLPLIPLTAGLAVAETFERGRWRPALAAVGLALSLVWLATDLRSTLAYHRVLALSGGVGAHSDAINGLADYLDAAGYRAPVALDWGLDAPLRFLTAGRVNPVEVFGYDRLDAADEGFVGRVGPYLTDQDNVYLAHAAEQTVFQGRVQALEAAANSQGWLLLQQAWFAQRSGDVLFIVYRAVP
ncbi:MAG: Dolichyl-phosphate-mannose-protein mannosyltransferase [Chloroflexi bacterium ADurb.Bin325]|nr:MAG: Dolichyl-phosphate-mannose-protein mannosyltransferase [Chloroflexi bacterium ADurb.Bin325]